MSTKAKMAASVARMQSLFRFASVLLAVGFIPDTVIADGGNLKLVNLLYRHGDRAPTEDFPTDIHQGFWKDGLGQLTNVGKMQQYNLGRYLRQRYSNLLNSTFKTEEILVRSTDVDRTLMSAYSNLAGLYPPVKDQTWDPELLWQPIPVHTMIVPEDFLLSYDSICPKYTKLLDEVKNSPEESKITEDAKEFFDFLTNKTGRKVKDIFLASDLYDVFWIQNLYNLSWPEWFDNTTFNKLKEYRDMDFDWTYKLEEMRRLRGGPFVGQVVQNMQDKIDGKIPARKMFMYSGHDMTITAVMKALDLYNGIFPPYFATILLELFEENNTYSVKLLYRNTTEHDPYELKLKDCTSPCPFEKFKELTAHIVPADIAKECSSTALTSNVALISAIAGSILGCTLLMLIVSAYAFYKRNSDNYRYFNVNTDTV